MDRIKMHLVPKQDQPVRLQEYGVGIFEETVTKSALKKALKKSRITVDNQIGTTATLIRGGEKIILQLPQEGPSVKVFPFSCHVLVEDTYLAVLRKPPGIRVSGNHFRTVANALPQCVASSHEVDAVKPQPVHRLDYGTTGVLLIGKTRSSIRELNSLFEKRAVRKTYFAVTIGRMKGSGEVRSPINGKEAMTAYTLVASVPSKRFGTLNLVQLQPTTGRRHQLRIHLAALGHPILGDADYGERELILKGKGLYLHAFSLVFIHPFTNQELSVSDKLPLKFKKLFPEVKW